MFDSPPPTSQLTLQFSREGDSGWTVRHSARARRLSVRVFRSGRVEVIVPRRTSAATVQKFVEQYRHWIDQKRAQALRNAVPAQPFPPARVELAACAESWRVHLAGGKGRPRIRMLAPGVLGIAGEASNLALTREVLRRWLMQRAAQILPAALASAAKETGMHYAKAAIRRQRSRWGSCSRRGTISLNACLLFQRGEVVRYLLIHELAHTLHMNHSRRFWECVARHCPQYQELDRELLEGWRRVPAWVFDRPS
jgi:predicted metal-dependent hydrolase